MTDIQLTPGDRLRLDVLLQSLVQGGTHLAVLSEHDLVLDHLANLIDERLRGHADGRVEFCFSTNPERLVQKFNDILSELTLDQALDKDRTHAPRRYLMFRDSILVQDSELRLLARLVNGFPASNISVILLVNSVGSRRNKLEAFGKSLVQWSVETRAGQPRQVLEDWIADPPLDSPNATPTVRQEGERPVTLAVAAVAPSWRIPDVGAASATLPVSTEALAQPAPTTPTPTPTRRRIGGKWWWVPLVSLLAFSALYRDGIEREYQSLRQYLLRGTPAPASKAASPLPSPADISANVVHDPQEEVLPSPRAAAAMVPSPEPVATVGVASNAQVSVPADDTWMEQLAAGGFVVQLAAFDTEAEILDFQRSDPVFAKARVVRVNRKNGNQRYYVLIAGPMATKAQAEAYMQSHRLLAKGWLRTAKSLKARL